jgi:hypothetical protein
MSGFLVPDISTHGVALSVLPAPVMDPVRCCMGSSSSFCCCDIMFSSMLVEQRLCRSFAQASAAIVRCDVLERRDITPAAAAKLLRSFTKEHAAHSEGPGSTNVTAAAEKPVRPCVLSVARRCACEGFVGAQR